MITTTNVRLGFATNSSSSHSIVFRGPTFKPGDIGSGSGDFEFGWGSFVLADAGSRAGYLAAAVYHSLQDHLPDYQIAPVLLSLFKGTSIEGGLRHALGDSSWPHVYIDHQSAFTLPFANENIFPTLLERAMEFFRDDRLTIYGGNDNSGDGFRGDHSLNQSDHDPLLFRRDGNAWVIFNWRTGAKLRLTGTDQPYRRASAPELVDVKLTDFCPYGCSFCYQGSTTAGKDADDGFVFTLIEALGAEHIGAFEIAFGGGEPTSHPMFALFINACLKNAVKPNFTTFAVDWLLDERKVEAARKCGGVGVSIHRLSDFSKVKKIKAALPGVQVVAQHVFGSVDAKETKKILEHALSDRDGHVLLLGWKSTHRGGGGQPHDMTPLLVDKYDGFPEYILTGAKGMISIDTQMIAAAPEFVARLKPHPLLMTSEEGAFSMYVDAVARAAGPSSFCSQTAMVEIPGKAADEIANEVLSVFRGIPS